MSPKTWRERFDVFLDDPRTIRAVAFEFTTMGEAARAIPEEIQKQYPEIPWGKMQGIRNVLVQNIFAWMKKFSGMQARMIFRP